MIAEHMAGRLALTIFAAACAWQDIRTMSIRRETVAGGLLMLLLGLLGVIHAGSGDASRNAVLIVGMDMILGCLPGILLMVISHMTGQVGAGDGIYFIIVGAALGLKRAVILLMLALFLNAIISAGTLIKTRIMESRADEKPGDRTKTGDIAEKTSDVLRRRLPFLPAASAALIWMLAGG